MSDDAIARLSRFTPDSSGLDRDALLFAAGRASARPNRRLLALAGLLTASQVLTLGIFLWSRDARPEQGNRRPEIAVERREPETKRQEARTVVEAAPPSPPESAGLWALRHVIHESEGNLAHSVPMEALAPSRPPLRAFGTPPADLLH
jgi:hypothetical protein